jgi:putative membrane protein
MNPPLASFSFPELNATLNAACVVLLVSGYAAIRRGRERLHITCMASALVVSSAFLASYLYYHYTVGHVSFGEQYLQRHGVSPPEALSGAYLLILLTHTVLAVTVAPLALVTACFGVLGTTGRWANGLVWHRRVAWWTLPIWLYVSVTGVIVYGMVYQL